MNKQLSFPQNTQGSVRRSSHFRLTILMALACSRYQSVVRMSVQFFCHTGLIYLQLHEVKIYLPVTKPILNVDFPTKLMLVYSA